MPDVNVLTREAIAADADLAAQRAAASGVEQPNPHPLGSDAAAAWHTCYCRYLLLHSAPTAEGSA